MARAPLPVIAAPQAQDLSLHIQTHVFAKTQRKFFALEAQTPRFNDPGAEVAALKPRAPPSHRYPVDETGEWREPSRAVLDREMRWLNDPVKLAGRVAENLRRGQQADYNGALALTRYASRFMECVVSWNHLINDNMRRGKVVAAVQLYTEMKSRAQKPDSYTYTMLFRGFGQYPQYGKTLERTLSIYHSMFAESSPVKPSILHTNAVLKVCAMVGDMDSLLGVAARLPPKGKGAPDKRTFTIVMQAMNAQMDKDIKGKRNLQEKSALIHRTVLQGMRVWEEICSRWTTGDLELDEELVCAMGRLLLCGHTRWEANDTFALLEQTMAIERQIEPLGLAGRRGPAAFSDDENDLGQLMRPKSDADASRDAVKTTEVANGETKADASSDSSNAKGSQVVFENEFQEAQRPQMEQEPKGEEPAVSKAATDLVKDGETEHVKDTDALLLDPGAVAHFEKVSPFAPVAKPLSKHLIVRPGANTLSLAVKACEYYGGLETAMSYWQLMRSRFSVLPDRQCYVEYLRLCRLHRDSKLACELVEEMADRIAQQERKSRRTVSATALEPFLSKIFRIAMSACVRNKFDDAAFDHARRITAVMTTACDPPEPMCVADFIDLALCHTWKPLEGQELDLRFVEKEIDPKTGKTRLLPKLEWKRFGDGVEVSTPPSSLHEHQPLLAVVQLISRYYYPGILGWYNECNMSQDPQGRAVGTKEESAMLRMVSRSIALANTVLASGRETLSTKELNEAQIFKSKLNRWFNQAMSRRSMIGKNVARSDRHAQIEGQGSPDPKAQAEESEGPPRYTPWSKKRSAAKNV